MKKSIILSILFLASVLTFSQEDYKITKSKVKITGTSTLHDWTADVTKLTGTGKLTFKNSALTGIENLTVSMEAATIKSSKGSMMDKKMSSALKAKDNPNIVFSLTKLTSVTAKNGGWEIKAEGKLTVAGTTKTIDLTAFGKTNGNGELTFTGSKKLKMTDFKVEPPVMMMGTLKTADDITISFETTLVKATIR